MHQFSRVQHFFHQGEKIFQFSGRVHVNFGGCKLLFDFARVQAKIPRVQEKKCRVQLIRVCVKEGCDR